MKAVLTALSRRGSLAPFNLTQPDCLLPVVNRGLVFRMIEALADHVEEIVILTGDDSEVIQCMCEGLSGVVVESLSTSATTDLFDYLKSTGEPVFVANASSFVTSADLDALFSDSREQLVLIDKGHAPVAGIVEVEGLEAGPYPDADALLSMLCKEAGEVIAAHSSIAMVYPWHLIEASVVVLRQLDSSDVKGVCEDYVTIKGSVVVGPGSVIKAGTTIEGPVVIGSNCVIGPSAYIRPDTVIGDGVTLGHSVEVFDSVVLSGTTGKHRSYIGHSVIGRNVNLGCGFITSDYRHDGANHATVIEGAKLDSGRRKLGSFVGDDVNTGVHTSMYPGRKIWPGCFTRPGEVVDKDILG